MKVALLLLLVAVASATVNFHESRSVPTGYCQAFGCAAAVGSPCATQNDTYFGCPFGSYCNSDNVCQAFLAVGDACDPNNPLCDVGNGFYCAPSGGSYACAPIPANATLGQPCSIFNQYCEGNLLCAGVCVSLPTLGQNCSGSCAGSSICNLETLICTARGTVTVGSHCISTDECIAGAWCNYTTGPFGVCTPGWTSSFQECTTHADCSNPNETCTCHFHPSVAHRKCEAPLTWTQAQIDATAAFYDCTQNNNCGFVCDACTTEICNYFALVENIPVSIYGYPQLYCLGETDLVDFVTSHCNTN